MTTNPSDAPEHRSGFVAIVGRPNAGKSTLLNALVGEKIAIVCDKPQTTRDQINGILSAENYQIVFVDMPGIIDPKDKLNEVLMHRVSEAVKDVDILYHLVDSNDTQEPPARVQAAVAATVRAKFLVLNKVDALRGRGAASGQIPPGIDASQYDAIFRISALRSTGVAQLIEATVAALPEGPQYYDPEQLSDRDERFLASEIVREKVLHHTGEEVPYAVHCEVETFEEKPQKDFIRIVVFVERDSQKGILIGEGGRMLKLIGQEARADIEQMTGRPAFLELWVKVRKNWRKNELELSRFGYKGPKESRKRQGEVRKGAGTRARHQNLRAAAKPDALPVKTLGNNAPKKREE